MFFRSNPSVQMDLRGRGTVSLLTPGRYVGAEEAEENDEPFADKMARLTAARREQTGQARAPDAAIRQNLEELGYGG